MIVYSQLHFFFSDFGESIEPEKTCRKNIWVQCLELETSLTILEYEHEKACRQKKIKILSLVPREASEEKIYIWLLFTLRDVQGKRNT